MRTILQWFQSGGPFIVPLILVGAAGLLLLAERVTYIAVRSKIHARPFIEAVISLVRAGKVDEALQLCAEHQSLLPDLGLVILRNRHQGESDLLHVAEAATLTVVPGLTRRLEWLPMFATIAILLGLLGAIANLHDALQLAARMTGSDRTALLEGAAYALRPLGVGVLVAIPLMAGHAYLASESRRIVGLLEEFAARLVNAMLARPDVRLGHRT